MPVSFLIYGIVVRRHISDTQLCSLAAVFALPPVCHPAGPSLAVRGRATYQDDVSSREALVQTLSSDGHLDGVSDLPGHGGRHRVGGEVDDDVSLLAGGEAVQAADAASRTVGGDCGSAAVPAAGQSRHEQGAT